MATTTLPVLLGTGDHASRPAADAVGSGGLYSCTTHDLIYQTDGSSWTTWATLGGLADTGAFTYLDATEAAAPATPATGKARIYAKADGRIYSKDDAGVEYGPFDAAGAGGSSSPLLYADSLALHASGDDFADTALTGWTLTGINTSTEVTAVTNELYDADCLDIVFAAQGDRLVKNCPAGDFTAYLTIHGVTNATSPTDALAAILALVITDASGNGTGVSLYTDNNGYMWAVASNIYSASGNIIASVWSGIAPTAAQNWPIVYRLQRVGSTITGGISFNGGASYKTNTRTDSGTFTKVGVHRLFTSGGTPTLRLGRFNIVE